MFHRLFTLACLIPRQWSLCLLIPVMLALTGGRHIANGSPIQLAPKISRSSCRRQFVRLHTGQSSFTVFIHDPRTGRQGIPLLARFEIPDSAPYIVPMDMTTTTSVFHHRRPRPTVEHHRDTPPTTAILIGRPRREQVEQLLSRTVIITIAIPGAPITTGVRRTFRCT